LEARECAIAHEAAMRIPARQDWSENRKDSKSKRTRRISMQVHRITCGVALTAFAAVAMGQTLSNADKQFLMKAATADMTEAHEGQMAQTQGTASGVKSFGQMLEQDHTQNFQQLEALAAKLNVTLPTGINTAKVTAIAQLQRLNGQAFDRAFARDEVAGHKQAIAEFKREAEHATNADVKAYAEQTVPVLEKHLSQAEETEKDLAPKMTAKK
jgi:putative membrane protein